MKLKPYACSYYHMGARWAMTIYAKDWEDALEKAKQQGLTLDGEMMMTTRSGLFARLLCWFGNLMR